MKYKAEIFDQVHTLFEETRYNDHQLHMVIRFAGKLNEKVCQAAVYQLTRVVPILARVYRKQKGCFYWEDQPMKSYSGLFQVVRSEEAFINFTCSRTEEKSGPQIRVCLLSAKQDALSIILNHMITDGNGLKRTAYLLAELYSRLLKEPGYVPKDILDGDRSFRKIVDGIRIRDRLKILFRNNNDNNQKSDLSFPMSSKHPVSPFILARKLSQDSYHKLIRYGSSHQVTVNDILLAAYFRVISELLEQQGKPLDISIMIDMRRYLGDTKEDAMTNLSSTVTIEASVEKDEDFLHTVKTIHKQMIAKKENYLGLNTFLKLHTLYKIAGRKRGYHILKKSLNNPRIAMTNIGIIDAKRLIFEGTPVDSAYACGSIKYRPQFQMAVTSFNESMTICVNLYGSSEDRENFTKFLNRMEEELNKVR